MDKKSVSATILVLFLALTFAVIGACFSTFVYQKNIIEFKEIKLIAADGIEIFDDKEYKNKISKMKLSDMKLGLKPATGEVDAETQIPSTITNEGTSEGYYETLFIKADAPYKIVVKDIKIENKNNETQANEERKNIFVSIKDVQNTTKSLEKEEIELVKFESVSEPQELVFLFWLGSLSGEELIGSKISFTLEFIKI